MKTLLLSLFLITCSVESKSQISLIVNLWGVNNGCPGDSMLVDYYAWYSVGGGGSTSTVTTKFLLYNSTQTITIWQPGFDEIFSKPKHQFGSGSTDTSRYVYLDIPIDLQAGSYTMQTIGSYGSGGSVSTQTLTLLPSPTISVSNATICLGSSYFIPAGGADTYTYSSDQPVTPTVFNTTYTVTGTATNGCYSSSTVLITSIQCVGIEELHADASGEVPVYYNLQGEKIEKRYNELIIERVGNYSKKVIIQN